MKIGGGVNVTAEFCKTSLIAASDVYSQTFLFSAPGLTLITCPDLNALEDISNGFFAQAFRDSSNNLIIAFEGTVPFGAGAYSIGSLAADATIAAGQTPQALIDAINLRNKSQMTLARHRYM